MLLESDKRKQEFAVKLTYAEDENDRFYIPDNVFIIGTMNTADRSLAIVDYALRRRFAFFALEPYFGDTFRDFLKTNGLNSMMIDKIVTSISKINNKISADLNLGKGYQIGHSYFCTFKSEYDEEMWYKEVVEYEIKPLLEEIWFDDADAIRNAIEELI
jgi:5-methylcytosine-specific restriction protein B